MSRGPWGPLKQLHGRQHNRAKSILPLSVYLQSPFKRNCNAPRSAPCRVSVNRKCHLSANVMCAQTSFVGDVHDGRGTQRQALFRSADPLLIEMSHFDWNDGAAAAPRLVPFRFRVRVERSGF